MARGPINRQCVKIILLDAKKKGRLSKMYQQMTDEELIAWVDARADELDLQILQRNNEETKNYQ